MSKNIAICWHCNTQHETDLLPSDYRIPCAKCGIEQVHHVTAQLVKAVEPEEETEEAKPKKKK